MILPDQLETKIATRGLVIPELTTPIANYLPFARVGSILHLSGQLPLQSGVMVASGALGDTVSIDQGVQAAQQCAMNLLAWVHHVCKMDGMAIVRCVKLVGFVQSARGFSDQPKVVNGASDFMVDVLGDAGRHARSAVGVPALPLNAAVEIEGIFELCPPL